MKFKGAHDALMWYYDIMNNIYIPPTSTGGMIASSENVLRSIPEETMRRMEEDCCLQFVKMSSKRHAEAGYDREDEVIAKCDLEKIISKRTKSEQRVYAAFVVGGLDYAIKRARHIFGSMTKVGDKTREDVTVKNMRRTSDWYEERVWRALNALEDDLLENDYLNPVYHYSRTGVALAEVSQDK